MLFEFFERIYAAEENGGNLRLKFSQRIHLTVPLNICTWPCFFSQLVTVFYTEATFMNTYWDKRKKGKTVDVYTLAGSVMGTLI